MVLNVKRPLFLLNPPTPETEIFVVVDILVKKCREEATAIRSTKEGLEEQESEAGAGPLLERQG